MNYLFTVIFFMALSVGHAYADMDEILESHLWTKRIVIMMAPSPEDARLVKQRQLFEAAQAGMDERDIVLWEIVDKRYVRRNHVVKPHIIANQFYEHFDAPKRGYTILLIGKDGEVKHRQEKLLDVDALFAKIDAMPMRQREMAK